MAVTSQPGGIALELMRAALAQVDLEGRLQVGAMLQHAIDVLTAELVEQGTAPEAMAS